MRMRPFLVLVLFLLSCSTQQSAGNESYSHAGSPVAESLGRMRVSRAALSLEVWNVTDARSKITTLISDYHGYLDKSSEEEDAVQLTVRIPSSSLTLFLQRCEALGSVESKNLSSDDVTEQYRDLQATLRNKVSLRDRLRELLLVAKNIQDVIAIEKELNSIQTEIDTLEGREKSLRGNTEFATVSISLYPTEILGPLGYLLKGTSWIVGKLFYIRG